MRLHGYFRSSAAYRVRIALHMKGLPFEQTSHHLRRGEQRSPDYLALNPQGLVPSLILDDGVVLTQSLAIIEWLDETHPNPRLIPADPIKRAKVRAFALAIACDIHPVQNLKVLVALKKGGYSQDSIDAWAKSVNAEGLEACERLLAKESGPFCFGAAPTLADLCLIPQMSNARRFGVDVSVFPKLVAADAAANVLAAFQAAAPQNQPDAE
jgi:maleylpyruvate isomerase